MKKLMYGLMAAGLSLGLAAPSFAAMAPSVQGSSQIVKVQTTSTTKKKAATKKAPTKKKTATKKAPAKKKSS